MSTNIDITLRGLTPAQLIAISVVLSDENYTAAVAPEKPRSKLRDDLEKANEVFNPAALEKTLDDVFKPAHIETPATYADSLAAAVFGGGATAQTEVTPFGNVVHLQTPNGPAQGHPHQGVYQSSSAPEPVNTAATEPQLTNSQPAAYVAGGTQDGVLRDSKGRRWDGRIHGSGKTFLAKGGEWKLVRNVDPALVARVNAELDAEAQGVSPAPSPAPQGVLRVNDVVQQVYTPPAAAAPAGPVFADVSGLVTGAIAAGTLNPVVVGQMLNHFGVPTLPALADRPDLWPTITNEVKRLTGAV